MPVVRLTWFPRLVLIHASIGPLPLLLCTQVGKTNVGAVLAETTSDFIRQHQVGDIVMDTGQIGRHVLARHVGLVPVEDVGSVLAEVEAVA